MMTTKQHADLFRCRDGMRYYKQRVEDISALNPMNDALVEACRKMSDAVQAISNALGDMKSVVYEVREHAAQRIQHAHVTDVARTDQSQQDLDDLESEIKRLQSLKQR